MLIIKLFFVLCDIRWSVKVNDDDIFILIDMNVEEFKGIIVYFFYLVLVVN